MRFIKVTANSFLLQIADAFAAAKLESTGLYLFSPSRCG
jgi:hypothetical protein